MSFVALFHGKTAELSPKTKQTSSKQKPCEAGMQAPSHVPPRPAPAPGPSPPGYSRTPRTVSIFRRRGGPC